VACLDDDTLSAWLEGQLVGPARAGVEAHVEQCDDCRALVIELSRAAVEEADTVVPLTVGARLGRYVVLDWLGAGGMGVVYAAFDPRLDRRVALKVLHPDPDAGEGDALIREAQALARVSHPNVVAVYDVGTHHRRVFVSMEYVHGQTLAGWLGCEERSPAAIVATFLEAARGLAAAHASGMVHHDFKPSNVLVGSDGRVRVTDFGLARLAAADTGVPAASGARSWKGTPGYMSPEQVRGERADARSDQYSFCAALHEALTGALPGEGAPMPAGVPARVRAAMARGLEAAPSDRFPTMLDLVAALTPELPARPRLLAVALAAALLGAAGVGTFAYHQRLPARPCAGAALKLTGVWDDDRRRAVASAFAATGTPFAGDAEREVARTLDAYAARWAAMHEQSCEATRVRGEQSEELMDLRVACLDGRAREMGALVESFAAADAKTVELAAGAVHALRPLEACADAAALRARGRPPADPAAKAEVLRVRGILDHAGALARAGHAAPALEATAPLLDAARAGGDRGLLSEVLVAVGKARADLGDLDGSDTALYDAVEAAESAGADLEKASALVQLTQNLAGQEARYDEATRAGGLAAAILGRLPAEVPLRTAVELSLAAVDAGRGRYAEALARTERARELREATFGPDDYLVAVALHASAVQLSYLGRAAEALAYQQREIAIYERVLGPHHPELAIALRNAAISERQLHRLSDALRDVRRARDIWRETRGDAHPRMPGFEGLIAELYLVQGHNAEARAAAERALGLAEENHVPEIDLVDRMNLLGAADTRLGRFDEAVALHTRAVATCARLSEPAFETAVSLHFLGEAYLGMGRPERALEPLERALTLRTRAGMNPSDVAENQVLLGRALWDSRKDRARARALVTEARAVYASRPEWSAELAQAEQWLAAHPLAEKK
jgi:tetratricopeptide (TPR) repeat protein